MEWIKQKLGLTPLSQQSHEDANASSSLPKNDRNNDDDVDMNHEEQSSEGGMELSFEMMETNHNYDSDDDDDGGGSGDDQDGQQLQYYLTQPRYNEEEDDDDSSVVKESSSVDIECNDMQARNDYNDSDDDSNEGSIPTQQRQEKKSKQPQGTIATKRGGRGGRAKRQMGDMLSQLPSTPTTTIQSSSSLSTSVAKKSKSSLAAAATATTAAELVASPQAQPVENTTSTPSIIMGGTTTPPLNSPPRNTTISEQQQVQNKNNGNNTTYTIHTKEEEPIMTLKSTPQPPNEHPLLCQLTMKQKAIDRSILHLSDNSYSFVYDELTSTTTTTTTTSKTEAEEVELSNGVVTSTKGIKGSAVKDLDFISWSPAGFTIKAATATTTTTESNKDESNNDNNGLPFIGPGLKDQYNTLLKLLRDGLLGTHNDDDDDTEQDNNNIDNIIRPKIQSNVSAILMGPRGHGKSLLLERCLAELSRVAGKRKERALKKMQRLQQLQQQQQQQQLNGGSDDDDDDDGIIQQLSKVNELYTQSSFRVVRINGLLYQGDNAVACTREIARQINSMSRMEKKNRSGRSSGRKGGTPLKESVKRRRTSSNYQDVQMTPTKQYSPTTQPSSPMMSPKSPIHANNNNNESHQFRLRRSGFNTNISLLDEALRTARIDGIPILIVLEELDTFLAGGKSYSMTGGGGTEQLSHQEQGGANDRQLLLYHLLDRVADHKFLVSLVGMTTNLSTINQLEKRVQSRAEGTSKVIYFGHDVNGGYDACVESLLGKFYTPPMLLSNKMMDDESGGMQLLDNDSRDECMEHTEMMNLRNEVEAIFRGKQAGSDEEPDCDQEINDFSLIQRALKRNYELHMDIRWFCGVLDVALSLLMSDIDELKLRCSNGTMDDDVQIPKLTPKHIAHALIIMGASLDDIASNVGRPGIPNQNALEQIRWGQLIGDPNHYSALVGTNPRLVALLDLSGPQIAVLMAARRIMARDNARSTVDDEAAANGNKNKNGSKNVSVLSLVAPLTYKRIEDEYTTSFVNSERYTISSDRYPPQVLYRSFMDLMELDLIRLKKEHCEGGALQYEYLNSLSTGANISNAPLYVNLEWELDFIGVLKAGLLKCSTSLREWGLKIMN